MLFCVAARSRPRIVSELAVLSRRADSPMYRSSCLVVVLGRPERRLSRDVPVVRTRSWSLEMTDLDTLSLLPIRRSKLLTGATPVPFLSRPHRVFALQPCLKSSENERLKYPPSDNF